MLARALILFGLTFLVYSPMASSQEVAIPASTYALVNARVVTSPDNAFENATVVIHDGKISEVGPSVSIPMGAIQIDLTDHNVYPGLIDIASTLGLAGNPGNVERPGIQPSRRSSQAFSGSTEDIEQLRKAGITTVGLAFVGGMMPGRVSVMNTGSGPLNSELLGNNISLQLALNGTSSGYPSTIMGAMAYIEQSWEDTRYDIRVHQAFQDNPATAPRPNFDPEHAALVAAVNNTMPVWFAAQSERELFRAAVMAERLGLSDYVFLGGQEGFLAVDFLRNQGRPVIVSLHLPDPDEITGRAFDYHVVPISGEDVVAEQADALVSERIKGNAARLVEAGITVALSSHGESDISPNEFLDLVSSAIEAGLPPREALRALTTTPAEILGLSGAIGTIEKGKMANLLVTNGRLFDDQTHILQVFVEGERFQYTSGDDEQDDEEQKGGTGR